MEEIENIRISNEVVPANFLNIPADLKSKGIYFWFADQEGLDIILEPLACKLFDMHYVIHDGKKLFLIYIGTAGTGKQKLSNLNDRFKWHLTQKHSHSSIKHGSLSNFRLALSLLLKTEVEGEEAAQTVNQFMSKYLYISWMPFENETLISTKEKDLIKTYFPFINDRHNDKGYKRSKEEYATKSFKELKAKFREEQKGNSSPNSITNQTTNPKSSKKMKDSNPPRQNQSPKKDDKGCFLIPFTDRDNLHEKVNQYQGMNGAVILNIYSNDEHIIPIYVRINLDKHRKTNNVYQYFQNPDTGRNNIQRHLLIQEEMVGQKIKNAILKVCPQDNSPQKTPSKKIKTEESIYSVPSNKFKTLSEIDFKSMEGKPKLLILPCSDSKISGGQPLTQNQRIDTFQGNAALSQFRQARREFLQDRMANMPGEFEKTRNGEQVTAEYFQGTLENGPFLPAIERYLNTALFNSKEDIKNFLLEKSRESQIHVIFISGLYGVLSANDSICDYHLGISDGDQPPNLGNLLRDTIDNYMNVNEILYSNVYYMLSDKYRDHLVINDRWNNLWIGNGTRNRERSNQLYTFLANL